MFVHRDHVQVRLLWCEWDPSGVGDLSLLQVLDELRQPPLRGGVVLQDLGEGAVFELIGQTLAQGFSGSEESYTVVEQLQHYV